MPGGVSIIERRRAKRSIPRLPQESTLEMEQIPPGYLTQPRNIFAELYYMDQPPLLDSSPEVL